MNETGRVLAVNTVTLGDVLVSATPAGTSVLYVEDSADFSEDGGWLRVNGEVLQYASVDTDADTITLTGSTTTAADESDRVEVWDYAANAVAQETIAHVSVEGADFNDDTLEAIVPHVLIPYLPDGIRETEAEYVSLVWDGADLMVENIIGKTPVFDGSVIDPSTLPASPPAPATDGIAPSYSPQPTLRQGIGTLFATWTPITNADPVTYDVHVSTTTPVVNDDTTLVGSGVGAGPVVIRTLKDGTPLAAGTTYYVALVARDADGAAAMGAEASGTPGQATSGDIAANSVGANEIDSNYVYAGQVLAEQIQSGGLQAALALLGSLTVGDPAAKHIILDPTTGLSVIGADGTTLVQFPISTDGMNTFDGNLTARGFTATDGATFLGHNNVIGTDSIFTLATGTTTPTNYPTVNTKATQSIANAAAWLATFNATPRGLFWTGTEYVAADPYADKGTDGVYRASFRFWNPSTNASRVVPIGLSAGNYADGPTRLKYADIYGAVALNGFLYAIVENPLYDVSTLNTNNVYQRYVAKFDATTGGEISEWSFSTYDYSPGTLGQYPTKPSADPTMTTDGTSLWIAQNDPSTRKIALRRFDNADAPTKSDQTITSSAAIAAGMTDNIASLYAGTADMPGFGFFVRVAGQPTVTYLDGSGIVSSTYSWPHPAGSTTSPFAWNSAEGRFVAVVPSSTTAADLVRMSKSKSSASGKAAFSWYDSNGTTHETPVGPTVAFTRTARYGYSITVQTPIPGGGGVDDPNTSRIYGAEGANALALLATGSTFTVLDDTPTGGAAPSASNTFTAGTASQITSASGGFVVRGDGSGDWPTVLNPIRNATPPTGDKWSPGDVKMSARQSPDTGWLLCDGTYVSQNTYSALFSAIGHSANNGTDPGNGTFRLPDFRNRYPIGAGYSTTLGYNDGNADGVARKNAANHVHNHTQADISGDGGHTHGITSATSSATTKAASGTGVGPFLPVSTYDGHNHGGSTTSTGSTHSHTTPDTDSAALNNGAYVHPFQAVNFFIKY